MQNIKKDWHDFKLNIKKMFKEFFNKETNKKQRANMWTFSRIIIALIVPILTTLSILTNIPALLITALGLTSFGAITDFFDGRSARKHNSTSEFGKTLDQVADKLFNTSIGISLSLLNPLFLLNILGEVLIASTNISYKLKYNNIDSSSSMIGKIKQWPLSLSFILGILSQIIPELSLITSIVIYSTLGIQLATSIDYAIKHEKEIKQINASQKQQSIENNTENKTLDKTYEKTVEIENDYSKKIDQLIGLKEQVLYENNRHKVHNPEQVLRKIRKNHQQR